MKETDINNWTTLMIEKLEHISEDWKNPWFTEGSLQWPRNLLSLIHISDAIQFVRTGDNYTAYNEDAVKVTETLALKMEKHEADMKKGFTASGNT